jgi:hypothetical protein
MVQDSCLKAAVDVGEHNVHTVIGCQKARKAPGGITEYPYVAGRGVSNDRHITAPIPLKQPSSTVSNDPGGLSLIKEYLPREVWIV